MKKTMIALAAFGAMAGAAHAQSSVTLYGLVDMFVGEATNTTTIGGVTTKTKPGVSLTSGGLSGSRWGLRGAEDLGGGLKATFQLEAGINADDGTVGAGFNRTSKVGLSGGFGSFEMGRQYTQLFLLMDSFDAQGTSLFSATNAIFGGLLSDAVRWSNSLVYTTPDLGGFNAAVQYAFGENGVPGTSAGRSVGLSAGYTAGPLAVQGVYQAEKAIGGGPTVKSTGMGISYDFNVVKALAQFVSQRDGVANGFKENGYVLSLSAPVTSNGTINVGYGHENINFGGTRVGKTSSFGLEYRHSLSKRTTAYAAVSNTKTSTVALAPAASSKDQLYGVGLRHAF